jgi:asparagine synthase (glutamine-hydrolysing)
LAKRRLPAQLWKLPKRGFTAPIGSWIAGRYARFFQAELLRPTSHVASHIDLRELERRFDAHRAGSADHGYTLWAAWVLERWMERMATANSSDSRLSGAQTAAI